MDAWKKCVLHAGKPFFPYNSSFKKFFWGGYFGLFFWGGGLPILFLWARGFSEICTTLQGKPCLETRESWPDQNTPTYRETGVAIPLSHCVSCGIAGYRCYTSGPNKTMTARDVTGFYVFFLRAEIGQFSPHFGGISLLNCTVSLENRQKIDRSKSRKIRGDGSRNCRFLSLAVFERLLTTPT